MNTSTAQLTEVLDGLHEEVLEAVPHRHFVFSIPKILRRYFLYDRKLLSDLSRCGWESLKEFFKETVPENAAVPGAVIAIQTLVIILDSTLISTSFVQTVILMAKAFSG